MKLQLVSVGTRLPSWIDEGFRFYQQRLPKDYELSLAEIREGVRTEKSSAKAIIEEGERILKAVPRENIMVALDVSGELWTNEKLANYVKKWHDESASVSFVIAGTDGFSASCLERAQYRWSLSPLVLPHGLVRIFVAEQLYRAWTILQNHPYHRK